MNIIFSLLITFAVLFIGAVNFMPAVYILGIISLVFFVYILSWSVGRPQNMSEFNNDNENENIPKNSKISLSSLMVLVATVILILGGSNIGGFLSNTMRIQNTEVRPNFETTMNLMVASWKQNLVLGVGPNRFTEFWDLHKPLDINKTQFWNAQFYSGSGFIPTIAITTGLLGLLSILIFIVMYVLVGVKAIFAQANAGRSRYLSTSSFLVSFYLWIMLFLYTPGITVLALTFIFTGIFTATLVSQGITGLWKINIFSNPKINFLSVLSIVILLIMSIVGGYFVWERGIAAVIFEKGIASYQNTGNIDLARGAATKAVAMVSDDGYWRGLTEISLIDLNNVLGSITNQNQITETIKAQAQNLITNSIVSSKKAVEIDNDSFQNWFALGRVYEILAQDGIAGSLDNARNSYNEASLRSPSNPSVPLALARLDALSGKIPEARADIVKALELKNNYTDAYFALAQLEVSTNNIPAAIKSVEAATVIDPNNSGLYFQLGLLKYNQKDFNGAISALERSITLVPDYANAKYFLGLSYYQVNRKTEAIKQFGEISAANPDNKEVATILTNMKSNKSLFPSAKSPESNPPVKEK